MPGSIVHLGTTVLCSHGGKATPTVPSAFVLIDKNPVITIASPYVIGGCSLSSSGNPCVSGQWTAGSTMVFASGQPVVLNTGVSTCLPNGTPMMASPQPFVLAT